jgi:hypothetical protein
VQLEGLGQLRKSTSSDFDPMIFQLLAQCFNQLCYHMPHPIIKDNKSTFNQLHVIMKTEEETLSVLISTPLSDSSTSGEDA